MILPSKHIPTEKALLTVSSQILLKLTRTKTVSALWEEILEEKRDGRVGIPYISYDWFVLALDLLYIFGVIEIKSGLLTLRKSP